MATTATVTRDPDLVSALNARNATFATLLSFIPQQYYIGPSEEQLDSRWMKNKKRKTGEEIKEHKRRAKQEKLDPSNLTAAVDDVPEVSEAGDAALPPAIPAPLPPAASISDLRERMRAKLDRFKRSRGFDDDPQSRDALEAAARQRRGDMRDKRRKERKEAIKRQREDVHAKPAKTQLIVPEIRKQVDDVILPSVALPSAKSTKVPLKKLANPSQALAHLEKHNSKLAQLPEEKRKAALERDLWAKAEARAAGTKIADEEKVLKKAVKREEKRKAKSGKAWNERKEQLAKAAAAKAAKRNDNLASRAEGKRNKRLGIKDKSKDKKVGGSKGKGTPGFGGKKGGKGKGDKSGKDKKARAGAKA
ncbi:hypothetical protein CC85DRAFT_286418 [Cutaneotrichosporon oleaginosum]|uniref:SURF6-domain-containing protein n=1 Tax=Cutaneotrichosporon oleaginosum TaxID=879819 RepID=A0A0J0XK77_9TREE|nr:uncharacterized protein CC85DRAFT_286418 [Cutaneotrichosporon oleaginosum]KLT41513.1 hypothetical protein CC85DRAFT_286418 [Cutaneotrichosporon oleaginosum]TXT05838.1 hypothetical protein COLE_07158 [Cutaneotrichosporon oleaginosum]